MARCALSPASGSGREIDALTQYFPNGEVRAINRDIMRHGERSDDFWYLLDQAEDAFMKTLKRELGLHENRRRCCAAHQGNRWGHRS